MVSAFLVKEEEVAIIVVYLCNHRSTHTIISRKTGICEDAMINLPPFLISPNEESQAFFDGRSEKAGLSLSQLPPLWLLVLARFRQSLLSLIFLSLHGLSLS